MLEFASVAPQSLGAVEDAIQAHIHALRGMIRTAWEQHAWLNAPGRSNLLSSSTASSKLGQAAAQKGETRDPQNCRSLLNWAALSGDFGMAS